MQKSVHFTVYTFFCIIFAPFLLILNIPYIDKYIDYEKNWLR